MNGSTNHTPEQLSRLIKAEAKRAGFALAGIAPVELLDSEFERLQEWLARDYHGDMTYMQRNADKRRDATTILPGARSMIVLGTNYFTEHSHTIDPTKGKVSRYAWGEDYHEVVKPRLESVKTYIYSLAPDSRCMSYTDTGAILEKAWAVRAGIGWQAKNTNIISRMFGSYFFIIVILCDAEIKPDQSEADYCGTCTACLDACPTQAFVQPYLLDATKCISYWTIEAKSNYAIPEDIARNADGWVFGCDVCQEVCPWNRFAVECDDRNFEARNDESSLNIREIETMTQQEFSERFRSSPIKRAKLAGLQRNARMLSDYYSK